jgi:hypothetical protein
MGAIQKALARGVPVCVVPHGHDHLEVVRRVEVFAVQNPPGGDEAQPPASGRMVPVDGFWSAFLAPFGREFNCRAHTSVT